MQMRLNGMLRRIIPCVMACAISGGMARAQTDEFPQRVDGDIGVGTYYVSRIVRGQANQVTELPYGNFDYHRMFMRVDTLGLKTSKLGYGYLEITTKFNQDGFNTNGTKLPGFRSRQDSLPLGLGTLQTTSFGALLIHAYHDINKSGGNLFDMTYFSELDARRLTFYPLAGAEYQSRNYVSYYYGVSNQEAALSQYAVYHPSGVVNPFIGLMCDAKLTEKYHLNLYLGRKWLGNAIQSSPIVNKSVMDTGFIALAYRFE